MVDKKHGRGLFVLWYTHSRMTMWDYLTLLIVAVMVIVLAIKAKAFTKNEIPEKEQVQEVLRSRVGYLAKPDFNLRSFAVLVVFLISLMNAIEAFRLLWTGSFVSGCRWSQSDFFGLYSITKTLSSGVEPQSVFSCLKLHTMRDFSSPLLFSGAVFEIVLLQSALMLLVTFLVHKAFLRWRRKVGY